MSSAFFFNASIAYNYSTNVGKKTNIHRVARQQIVIILHTYVVYTIIYVQKIHPGKIGMVLAEGYITS